MKRNINRTPIIGISLPWSLEEWSKSKVAEVCADWRFPAFLDEWKREILKNKPSIDVYLALAICTPKSCPKSLRDLYENQERFVKIMQRLRRRVLSVNEIERILNRCTEIISLTPQFFPCSALTFEFLTVVIDFSEFAIKKFKHSNAAKLKITVLNYMWLQWGWQFVRSMSSLGLAKNND